MFIFYTINHDFLLALVKKAKNLGHPLIVGGPITSNNKFQEDVRTLGIYGTQRKNMIRTSRIHDGHISVLQQRMHTPHAQFQSRKP